MKVFVQEILFIQFHSSFKFKTLFIMQIQADIQKSNTIIDLWKHNPEVFQGKYKSGATPKTDKEVIKIKTEKKYQKIDFNDLPQTPIRKARLNLVKTIQNDTPIREIVPKIQKRISKIEQEEEQHSPRNKNEGFMTPPKKSSNCDFDKTLKDSYKDKKHQVIQDDNNSRFEKDYEELQTLGTGCFGVVKKCKNRVDGNIYAIKIMRPFEKNLNQVKALANLSNHECNHIVRYHNSWIENKKLYMVMEYCQKSLKKMIDQYKVKNIRFSEKQIKHLMQNLLHALQQLHSNNIVHLDIKPQNILRTLNGRYKIGDLGLSRIAKVSLGEDVNEGDSKYLAKQILNNFNQNELPDLTKADIFSFGLTLYELISMRELPNGGEQWNYIRQGGLSRILSEYSQFYSNKLLTIICNMTDPRFNCRLSAKQILKKPYFFQMERQPKLEQKLESRKAETARKFSL